MPHYLIKFAYTPEAWSRMIDNPEDRQAAVRAAVEALGGTLVGYWLAFGEADGYVLAELPDNVTAAAASIGVAASGRFRMSETTVLITPEEMRQTLEKAQELSRQFRPPGGN